MSFSWLKTLTTYWSPREGFHTWTVFDCPADAISDPSLFHFDTMTMLLQLKILFISPWSLQTRESPSDALVTTRSPDGYSCLSNRNYIPMHRSDTCVDCLGSRSIFTMWKSIKELHVAETLTLKVPHVSVLIITPIKFKLFRYLRWDKNALQRIPARLVYLFDIRVQSCNLHSQYD